MFPARSEVRSEVRNGDRESQPRGMRKVYQGDRPAFDISIRVSLNVSMITEIVDILDRAQNADIEFSPTMWAFYHQLSNFLSEE